MPYPKSIKLDRRKFFTLIAIVTSLLIIGGIAFYHWAPNSKGLISPQHTQKKMPPQQTLRLEDSSRLRTFEGVPMAAVSDKGLESKPGPNKNISSKRATKLPTEEINKFSTLSDIEEIEKLIQSTTSLAKKKTATSPIIQSGHIPGFKVIGIIFFDKNNSSNHIILTAENNRNLKLRVGQTAQGAILKSIHPNHAIFLNNNQLIQVNIGK